MKAFTPALVLAAACGSNSAKPDALTIVHADASVDASSENQPPQLTSITFQSAGGSPLALFAYKDGASGTWQTPSPDTSGNYTIMVGSDYIVVYACTTSTGSEVDQSNMTAADGSMQYVYCGGDTSPTTGFAVTGQMKQAGTVFMGDSASGTTSPWSFTLNVPSGMNDLVALDSNRMLIRRGQNITAAMTEATIDVVTNGTAMRSTALTLTGRTAGDTLLTQYSLQTGDGYAFIDGTSATVESTPAALVMSGDTETLFLEASTSTLDRTIYGPFDATMASYDLPPVLTGVTLVASSAGVTASWATLPTFDNLFLDVTNGSDAIASAQFLYVTPGWVAATSATSLAFDTSAPGYDPSWSIDLTKPYERELGVEQSTGQSSVSSSVYATVNAMAIRSPAHALRSVRRHRLSRTR